MNKKKKQQQPNRTAHQHFKIEINAHGCEMSSKCHQVLAACFNQRRSLFINKRDQERLVSQSQILKSERKTGQLYSTIDKAGAISLGYGSGVC